MADSNLSDLLSVADDFYDRDGKIPSDALYALVRELAIAALGADAPAASDDADGTTVSDAVLSDAGVTDDTPVTSKDDSAPEADEPTDATADGNTAPAPTVDSDTGTTSDTGTNDSTTTPVSDSDPDAQSPEPVAQ